ncbi:urease accessory protein UreE [Agaribacterium sp. ZY112]|uniref:urease accessory protein UreE n=1 Tax=Agaribacterium sp. ZY112 TaxID=3233574 RepID=UPI003523F61C
MLEAHKITHLHEGDKYLEVIASFEERKKSRYRTSTSCGQELGWFIERGYVLQEGDVLVCNDGTLVVVRCADEKVSNVTAKDELSLLRAAYHLGNRHVPLQVRLNFLRYQEDYVLDDMVKGLGLTVEHIEAPFEPENGAYGGGHHHHDH